MAASEPPRTKAHVVLGSGGVKTLAYVGALEVLAQAGIEFASVSACSAGSLIGALVANGAPMDIVRAKVEAIDIRRLTSHSKLPGILRFASCLKWPFAAYDSDVVVQFMEELLGSSPTFGELAIPFATAGIDLLSQRLLVYASDTHENMKVADAVRIAVGIPLLFPPHDAGGRVVVDAAFATQCPIWMVGRFDDEYPILALKPTQSATTTVPRRLDRFLTATVNIGVSCRDQYLIDEIPRVRLLELPVADLEDQDFAEAQRRKPYLLEAGRRVAAECLRDWGPDLAGRRRLPVPVEARADAHDDEAVKTASSMMRGFANRLSRFSRRQLFISYSHQNRPWLEVVKASLQAYVELRGLEVWDDTRIEPGHMWHVAIEEALASTRVALLLVSREFLSSRFIRKEELSYFLAAADRFAVKIHWLPVNDIGDAPNPLANRQALLDPSTPLDSFSAQDLVRALAAAARTLATDLEK